MRWPWHRKPKNNTYSISDPAIAPWFIPGGAVDLADVVVGEHTALGLSAFYRALSLISGTLASLPFRSYREGDNQQREKVGSIFDDPDGPDGQTVYEWKESAFLHLLLHGRTGALKVRNQAGGIVRLPLVHPMCFRPVWPTTAEVQDGKVPLGGLWFDVYLNDGSQVRFDANDFWYVPGLSLDGRTGISLLTYARLSLGTSVSGDRAAATMFNKGALISGLATPEDDLEVDDLKEARLQIDRATGGYDNAGKIVLLNKRMNFTPWTMSAVDAQFLQSRQFQIEEIARWTGVPPHLLMQTEKQTSWGTGVEMQDRALGRTVLNTWANRFEQRASRLLARPRWAEFDFAGLERPAPEKEIELLIAQVNAGFLTLNEARAIRNLPPVDGGDVVRSAGQQTAQPPEKPQETSDANA